MSNSSFGKNVKNDIVSSLRDTARDMLDSAGMDCCIDECEHFSIGFKCTNCGGNLCNKHLYFRFGDNKPSPICPFCIVDENDDIFESDGVIVEGNDENLGYDAGEYNKSTNVGFDDFVDSPKEEFDDIVDASFEEI